MVSSESPPGSADTAEAAPEIILRPIRPGDRCTGFSLGAEEFQPLKSFLQDDAQHYHSNNIARTYVLVPGDPKAPQIIRGYISLMCSEITLEGEDQPDEGPYRYAQFPSVKIARLAVDRRYSERGFGCQLIEWAVTVARDMVMPNAGCRFLIVDSKASAVGFYQRRGFTLLEASEPDKPPIMYVDLQALPEKAGPDDDQAEIGDLRSAV